MEIYNERMERIENPDLSLGALNPGKCAAILRKYVIKEA